MADTDKIIMFPDGNNLGNNNGNWGMNGWGGGLIGFILGILFGNGGFWGNGFGNRGNGGLGGGTDFLAGQTDMNSMREMIMNAINGTDADVRLLASNLNTDLNSVKSALCTINSGLTSISGQVGMSSLQVVNAIQQGNTSLANQLAQCCCDNRLLTTQQGYESQIRTLEQTNQLGGQADRNNNAVLNAIANQSVMIQKEFCDARERDMQEKINTLTAENATLKNNINNSNQTAQIAAMINSLQNELNQIKAAQPQTITLPMNQYQVVPSLAAGLGTDLVASYLANRVTSVIGASAVAASEASKTSNS